MSKINLVLASEVEEFFYEGSDEPVPEGEHVGIDWEDDFSIDLHLFENIYFQSADPLFWECK